MGISPFQLGMILLIVVLIFGTKKLKNMGGDLGGAIKNFKKGIKDDEQPEETEEKTEIADKTTAEKAETVAEKAESKDS